MLVVDDHGPSGEPIVDMRRAQVELDAARERYFELFDLAPVGYCIVGEQGLILEANLTAAGLLGIGSTVLSFPTIAV